MKKRSICALALVLLLFAMLPIAAFAAENDSQARLDHVTDLYGLLSDSEVRNLEGQAKALSEKYGCSLYILVVKDYTNYADSTFQFAINVFEQYELGWGADHTGVMLMLSMADRDYELLFHGSLTDRAFTEYGRDQLESHFLREFRNDDFYEGFQEYLSYTGELLEADRNGQPVEKPRQFSILFFLPGVIAAAVTGIVLTAPMKSAGQKREANDYLVYDSVQLYRQSDIFLKTTTVRTPRNTDSGSSGGSHHSGGYSGRSGKF